MPSDEEEEAVAAGLEQMAIHVSEGEEGAALFRQLQLRSTEPLMS